jgi:hypothetical protein
VILELLPLEKTIVAEREATINTVTFFRGDYERAKGIFEENVREILRANPWLAGQVGRETLEFPYVDPGQLPPDCVRRIFEVCDGKGGRRALDLHRYTPYTQLGKVVRPLMVETGPCDLLWRVCLVPDSKDPEARFALVTSLTHAVGDGNTYYKIQNMLCGNEIHSLNPVRNFEVHPQTTVTKTRKAIFSPSFLLRTVWGMLESKFAREKCIVDISILNETWVKEQKASKLRTPGVSFISTNDAVTSWFLNSGNVDLGFMAINFRDRISGCRQVDAGNYEDIMFYLPPDFKSPSLIRKSLATLERASEPKTELPNTLAKLRSHSGLITNWSTFVEASHIPGCEQELHLPLYDIVTAMPYNWTLCIVFRQCPGKLGLFIAGQPSRVKLLKGSLGPMGNAMDCKL